MAGKKKGSTKGGTTTVTKKGSTAKATAAKADGPSKREAQQAKNAELRDKVVSMRADDAKWSEIATKLHITSGKAQFLFMQHCVAEGEVSAIRFKQGDEASLIAGIRKAREANDAHSSWGWIAARTGVSEGKIKSLAEEAGMPVKGSNVAVARAEANGSSSKSDGKTKTQAKTGGKKGAAASKVAKAKAKAKKGSGNA